VWGIDASREGKEFTKKLLRKWGEGIKEIWDGDKTQSPVQLTPAILTRIREKQHRALRKEKKNAREKCKNRQIDEV